MKKNKKLLSLIVLSLLLAKPYNVFAAGADSFRTDEYKAMGENVLDLINAAGAYAQGYTGKGVTVGVPDAGTVNFSHPEFSGKTGSGVVFDELESPDVPLTWEEIEHPTHVAGIAAADKNGFGMHGVAYDADIASSSTIKHYYGGGFFESGSSFYDNYLTNPDIKIINNSWGDYNNYLSNVQNEEDFNKIIANLQNDIASLEIEKAVNNDKLLVFGAGNDGKLAAALENNLDVLTSDKAFNDNIITVTAAKANSFTKNQNGGFDVKSDAIAIFSNLAMYNEDTTLSAPGWNINSAYADFDASGKYYKDDSGTSMAAPMVTGVGALVQQAFPYLSGKQIGDVLLSTANNYITANNDITNEDSYFITRQSDYDENDNEILSLNVLYTGSVDSSNVENDIFKYFDSHRDSFISFVAQSEDDYRELLDIDDKNELMEYLKNKEIGYDVYNNVPLDVIFGQGIVDAGKAVNGLGAINVRRLDKSDISSDYTVAGVNGKTKQALYTVDTQGYNSTWSNSIGEIRAGYIAENPLTGKSSVDDTDNSGYDENSNDFNEKFAGLTDLHDRWVFYTTNNFDDNPVDSEDYNWMVNHYIQQYNKQVAASGLAGLHAGLYKTGEGILALAGDNTYKGASIAAGGTLQIDGSVAGDAYSEGAGTIAGSGIINGSLYNNGAVEAGSWGAVTDKDGNALKLTVNGKLDGNGVIAVNTDGINYAQISVSGTADVSNMSLKAGTFAAPEVTGTILSVDATSGTLKGIENLNGSFSGMLNGEVSEKNNMLTLTTSVSNNAGIDGARFKAFNGLYNNLNVEEKQEMQRLYALDNNSLNNTVNELSQSESMHMELARDAVQNRDVRQAVARQQHLDRDEGLWAITGKNWGETDGGLTRHSYNLTLGKDFYNSDSAYAGALFAYSDNSIGGNNDDGEYKNYSLGIYGGSKNSPGTVTGYVSYGVQDNELTRNISSAFSHSGMGSKLESDYDSSVIGVGAKYAYDLHYGKEGWHVSPYAALDYAHYKQDSFTESGSVFDVHSGGFSNNYLTGELGFDFSREEDNGKYGFSLAYKRILDGDTLDADFAFAKGGNSFGVQSIDGSKNHIVASAYISTKLSDKWEIGGTMLHDWSSTDRDLSAAVNLNYYF